MKKTIGYFLAVIIAFTIWYTSSNGNITAISQPNGESTPTAVTPSSVSTPIPAPTLKPESEATAVPEPAGKPTSVPTATLEPSNNPTQKATAALVPTNKPTPKATAALVPTNKPTPNASATLVPTKKPTAKPTISPTKGPTAKPTKRPEPTKSPTPKPTVTPIHTQNPTPKPTATPEPTAEFLSAVEDRVIVLVNIEREKVGIQPLEKDNILKKTARYKSEEMGVHNYFAHKSPVTGYQGWDIAEKVFGFKRNGSFGENIWKICMPEETLDRFPNYYDKFKAYVTAESMMDSWMNSEGHRKNILDPDYKRIGVGVAVFSDLNSYATQVFSE